MGKIKKITVKYNGQIVGYLEETSDQIAFQYDEKRIKHGFSISPLSLPLTNKIYKNGKSILRGLYGVFYDSLPGAWGETLLRRMLFKVDKDLDKLSSIEYLSLIGKNGLGALEYEPSEVLIEKEVRENLDTLSIEANNILNNKKDAKNLDELYILGGTSGGTRPKIHINIDDEERIIKFPCRFDPKEIGKKEFLANSLAQKCGINTNKYKLFDSKICGGYFGVKRFDRTKNRKVHMISLASILETRFDYYSLDYGHLFRVIKEISVNKNDLYEAFRRMCFNVFYHNTDDHGKNFSFLYDEELKGYILSPCYDLTKTEIPLEHSMTINDKGNPSIDDLLALAKEFELSIPECEKIISNIKKVLKVSD